MTGISASSLPLERNAVMKKILLLVLTTLSVCGASLATETSATKVVTSPTPIAVWRDFNCLTSNGYTITKKSCTVNDDGSLSIGTGGLTISGWDTSKKEISIALEVSGLESYSGKLVTYSLTKNASTSKISLHWEKPEADAEAGILSQRWNLVDSTATDNYGRVSYTPNASGRDVFMFTTDATNANGNNGPYGTKTWLPDNTEVLMEKDGLRATVTNITEIRIGAYQDSTDDHSMTGLKIHAIYLYETQESGFTTIPRNVYHREVNGTEGWTQTVDVDGSTTGAWKIKDTTVSAPVEKTDDEGADVFVSVKNVATLTDVNATLSTFVVNSESDSTETSKSLKLIGSKLKADTTVINVDVDISDLETVSLGAVTMASGATLKIDASQVTGDITIPVGVTLEVVNEDESTTAEITHKITNHGTLITDGKVTLSGENVSDGTLTVRTGVLTLATAESGLGGTVTVEKDAELINSSAWTTIVEGDKVLNAHIKGKLNMGATAWNFVTENASLNLYAGATVTGTTGDSRKLFNFNNGKLNVYDNVDVDEKSVSITVTESETASEMVHFEQDLTITFVDSEVVTLTVDGALSDYNNEGEATQAKKLTVAGTGTLVLSGTSRYTGGTEIPGGVKIVIGSASALGSGAVTGEGTVYLSAGATINDACFKNSTAWTGTFVYTGTLNDDTNAVQMNTWGNANSTLAFEGATGYFANNTQTVNIGFVELIGENALTINNGYSSNGVASFGKLKGAGTLKNSGSGGAANATHRILFTDAKDFSGAIALDGYGRRIGIGVGASDIGDDGGTITIGPNATIRSTKTWTTKNGIVFKPGATIDATEGALTVTGNVTFGETLKVKASAEDSVILKKTDASAENVTLPTGVTTATIVQTVDGVKVPYTVTNLEPTIGTGQIELVLKDGSSSVKPDAAAQAVIATAASDAGITELTEVKVVSAADPSKVYDASAADAVTLFTNVEPVVTVDGDDATKGTATIKYDFGVERMTIAKGTDNNSYVVLLARVKNDSDNSTADFNTGTNLVVDGVDVATDHGLSLKTLWDGAYYDASANEGVGANKPGYALIAIALGDLNATHKLKIKASKTF